MIKHLAFTNKPEMSLALSMYATTMEGMKGYLELEGERAAAILQMCGKSSAHINLHQRVTSNSIKAVLQNTIKFRGLE